MFENLREDISRAMYQATARRLATELVAASIEAVLASLDAGR